MSNKKQILNEVLSLMIGKEPTKKLIKHTSSLNTRKTIDYTSDQLYRAVNDDKAIHALDLIKQLITEYFEPETGEVFNLSSPYDVASYLAPYLKTTLGNQSREHFMVLFLNASNKLISKEIMFMGTVDQAQIYPREIIKQALIKNASSIILVHNHPSGTAMSSTDDETLTKKIENLSKDFNLRVYDHLIATEDSIYSLRLNKVVE